MPSGRYGLVLREVGRLLAGETATSLDADQLLVRFAAHRDPAAFEALVIRHGPMVLATCRRMLGDPHDVDDAFQATFLVLARKAGSIRDADRLGPWLHGVARRVALRSRTLANRRKVRERTNNPVEPGSEPDDPLESQELRAALDDELARLPEKYRVPLVLCYLEGLTHDEAAEQLRWPVGTVRSRLSGGRSRLKDRLTRRGVAPPSATLPALLSHASIPPALMTTTLQVATTTGSIPAQVATLAKGALLAMIGNKIHALVGLGLLTGLTLGGARLAAQQPGEGGQGKPKSSESSPAKPMTREERLQQLNADRTRLKEELNATLRKAEDLKFRMAKVEEEWRVFAAGGDTKPDIAPNPTPVSAPAQGAGQAVQPIINVLNDSSQYLTIIPPERDRITIFNTDTQKRSTFRLTGQVKEIIPITAGKMTALSIKGSGITRTAVFDANKDQWFEYDLSAPVEDIKPVHGSSLSRSDSPLIGHLTTPDTGRLFLFVPKDGTWVQQECPEPIKSGGDLFLELTERTATYRLGRSISIYNALLKRWSTLTLKRDDPHHARLVGTRADGVHFQLYRTKTLREGQMIFPDGDVIHLYDPKTGDWTHIDTRENK